MSLRIRHGGDITGAEAKFSTPPEGWLDLSTGINPVPYPVASSDIGGWRHLPTAGDELRLVDAARAYYGVPDHLDLILAPGTQALIQWLPRLRRLGTVDVISPTYGEHMHCWAATGHQVREIGDLEQADADVVIVVNPNNPDGRLYDPDALEHALRGQRSRGGWLIVDEAFGDLEPVTSATNLAMDGDIIILKSFGKFFGLAGLRLGFAITPPTIACDIRAALGPWATSGPAISIGRMAFADQDWHQHSLARLATDAERMDGVLRRAGFSILGGTNLFRLADVRNADALYEKLAGAGILVRIFDHQLKWARFGLPGHEDQWQRLEAALA